MAPPSNDYLLAIHEAGHATAALALGYLSKGLSLGQDRGTSLDSLSRTRYDPTEAKYWVLLKHEVLILLAGEFAMRLLNESLGDDFGDDFDAYGSQMDRSKIGYLIEEIYAAEGGSALVIENSFERDVIALLKDRMPHVQLLARELQLKRQLSGNEIELLLANMKKERTSAA